MGIQTTCAQQLQLCEMKKQAILKQHVCKLQRYVKKANKFPVDVAQTKIGRKPDPPEKEKRT
jgi:hypothetical protein